MKNESAVLPRLLNSVFNSGIISGYSVVDTGSTDNSKQIVKDFFDSKNIPGEIHDYTFTNFADTRNFALSKIKGKCDFGFLIDADEELVVKEGFDLKKIKNILSKHDLGVSTVNYGVKYGRRNFFRTSKNFFWEGAVHEVLLCNEPHTVCNIDGLETVVHPDGSSWTAQSQREKYLGHAKLLEQEVAKTDKSRDTFYLAQSYRDAGEHLKSIDWYRKRIGRTDGFGEERYFSQYSIGKLYQDIAKFPEAILEWLRCFDLDDQRAEHLPNLIIELQEQKCWNAAYIFSKYGMEKYYGKNPHPNKVLFLNEGAYGNQLMTLHLQNCRILGKPNDMKMAREKMSIGEFFSGVVSGWTGHREFAKWLVEEMNPAVILDLGVDYGFSTYSFAMAKKGKVYGIDNFQGDFYTGVRNTSEFVRDSVEYLKGKGIGNIEIINGDFYKIAENWKKKIDILHIDEIPTNIQRTYDTWKKFVKDDGVILFHNTEAYSEVRDFFNAIPDMHKYQCGGSGGLGVISKNSRIIEKIWSEYPKSTIKKEVPKNEITIAFIKHNEEVLQKYLMPSIMNLNRSVTMVSIPSSKGMPAENYNKLLAISSTKYVLFLHEDTTFSPDFLDRIDMAIAEHPDFGAMGAVGNYKNNIEWGTVDKIREVITCDGCCILVNKEHDLRFDSVTFDEYHLYVDDMHLQLHHNGLKNYTIPINAYEASLAPSDSEKDSFFKHHSATVSSRGYCWGRYNEFLEKMEDKWANVEIKKEEVDVCIVSYAKTDELKRVTERGIETLLASEKNIKFNVFVMESNPEICYDNFPNTKTIYPSIPFNYNAYLNLLIAEGKSPYVALCNSDLTYEKGWMTEIIIAMRRNPKLLSTSPLCPQTQNKKDFPNDLYFGYQIRRELAGWCIVQQRKTYSVIGKISEGVQFWYSDNVLADQLMLHNVVHGLVTKSIVNHHEHNLGVTGNSTLDSAKMYEFTQGQHQKYLKAKEELYNSKRVSTHA